MFVCLFVCWIICFQSQKNPTVTSFTNHFSKYCARITSKWHPFSISSSPHQEVVTLHIRNVGYWTNKLYQIADTCADINILLEGPYGSLAVDLFSERYKMIMLFSGGIG